MINIQDYTGLNIPKVLKSETAGKLYMANWNQLHLNYGDNVEWQKLHNQILLCDETRDYLYQKPQPVKYVKGTRPYLEKKVAAAIKDCKTEREIVLALLVFCRDNYKNAEYEEGIDQFYGGTEEELIKKGENLCECLGRLMVSLCEICGIPGRIVMHLSGHITSEIYLEGKWAFFDPRMGLFYLDENDRLLSVDEIVHNREVIKSQKDWVKAYISEKWTYEDREAANYKCLLHPKEIQLFCPYSLMDADEYDFEWRTEEFMHEDGMSEATNTYRTLIKQYWEEENYGD